MLGRRGWRRESQENGWRCESQGGLTTSLAGATSVNVLHSDVGFGLTNSLAGVYVCEPFSIQMLLGLAQHLSSRALFPRHRSRLLLLLLRGTALVLGVVLGVRGRSEVPGRGEGGEKGRGGGRDEGAGRDSLLRAMWRVCAGPPSHPDPPPSASPPHSLPSLSLPWLRLPFPSPPPPPFPRLPSLPPPHTHPYQSLAHQVVHTSWRAG